MVCGPQGRAVKFIHSCLQQLIYYNWKWDHRVLHGQPGAEIKAYKRARITWRETSEADTHAIVKRKRTHTHTQQNRKEW